VTSHERLAGHRPDYDLIESFVPTGARVLDLGCGDGQLLARLARDNGCAGYGVEIREDQALKCVQRGVPVYHGDMSEAMSHYHDGSFDMVILSQTLHQTTNPRVVIHAMLRVGETAIISFPNLGHWKVRWHLLARGSMPVNSLRPYSWYDSPNAHLCTVRDFRILCAQERLAIVQEVFLSGSGRRLGNALANWRAELAVFQITRRD
jgi:methionine biosynthesis protein MetW